MLPATTVCPPYSLIPRRRPAESRPLREDPPAFLCAMVIPMLALLVTQFTDEIIPDFVMTAILLTIPVSRTSLLRLGRRLLGRLRLRRRLLRRFRLGCGVRRLAGARRGGGLRLGDARACLLR